jgi:hypothetical protein
VGKKGSRGRHPRAKSEHPAPTRKIQGIQRPILLFSQDGCVKVCERRGKKLEIGGGEGGC